MRICMRTVCDYAYACTRSTMAFISQQFPKYSTTLHRQTHRQKDRQKDRQTGRQTYPLSQHKTDSRTRPHFDAHTRAHTQAGTVDRSRGPAGTRPSRSLFSVHVSLLSSILSHKSLNQGAYMRGYVRGSFGEQLRTENMSLSHTHPYTLIYTQEYEPFTHARTHTYIHM